MDLQIQDREVDSKPKLKQRILNFFKNPKKRWIFIGLVALFLALVSTGIYFLIYKDSAPAPAPVVVEEPKVETPTADVLQSPLDGVMTTKEIASTHPLAIVVENHPDARPQSGLSQASLVYEAIAEGGITRFLALFGSKEAEKVGPVRSARTYFVDWAHGYNAFLAHVGGNIDALDKIAVEKTFDLDQFKYPKSYWREYAAGLATEHTMYTSTTKLRQQAAALNYPVANNFTVYKFKDDPALETRPETQTVAVNFSSASYNVIFQYDKTTNSYKRLMAGKAHTDKATKESLNPKNVVVMTVARKATLTRINEPGYDMTTTGSGKAQIFIDGKTVTGSWKKTSPSDREIFYDETGQEIIFDRGQFWICVIPPESTVTVK